MEHLIAKLEALHATLVEALDAGDIERLAPLVQERGALMERLTTTHHHASAGDQASVADALRNLACLDQDLQARFHAQRDQLGHRLAETRRNAAAQPPAPTVSGVLDRRA